MARGWGALVKWVPSFDDAGASPSAWGPAGGVGPAGPQGNPGAQGPAGPAGADGTAGPAGLNWKGAWAVGTAYVLNDAVGRNNASWFATGAVAAGIDPNPSGDGHTAQAPWQLLAAQGATGPTGPQGPAGATGPAGPQGPAGGGGGGIPTETEAFRPLGPDIIVAAGANHTVISVDLVAGHHYLLRAIVHFANPGTNSAAGVYSAYFTEIDAGSPSTANKGAEKQNLPPGESECLEFEAWFTPGANITVFVVLHTETESASLWSQSNTLGAIVSGIISLDFG